jgi:hypothetical protein
MQAFEDNTGTDSEGRSYRGKPVQKFCDRFGAGSAHQERDPHPALIKFKQVDEACKFENNPKTQSIME